MNSAQTFFVWAFWGIVVLSPLALWAVFHDITWNGEWSPRLKRLYLGWNLAVFIAVAAATAHAAELPVPSADDCAAWSHTAWDSITYWWWLFLC